MLNDDTTTDKKVIKIPMKKEIKRMHWNVLSELWLCGKKCDIHITQIVDNDD